MDNNLTRLIKGLFKDSSPQDQPKESYRFGLNGIIETDQGDNNFISNEESNVICGALTPGYIPIGKVYIGNDRVVVFSVSADDTISEIGIYYTNNCEYEVHVNDEDSLEKDKLGFSIQYQIQATYRLRRGCEDTIYWVDANKKPRYYNFNSPDSFKIDGKWNQSMFSLIKEYSSIPEFKNVTVLDSGGQVKTGSYNIAIQYVDEDMNGTDWITTSPVINIYNDSLNNSYRNIRGAIISTAETTYFQPSETSKSIRVELEESSLDRTFIFYRLAFIEATSSTGIITSVRYTEVVPIDKNWFIYTGTNVVEEGTQEDILFFTDKISKASHIDQSDNMLILAATEGTNVNLCKLQKYASKIKADCVTKKVDLSKVHPITSDYMDANPKNPTAHFEGFGYMPGEIYSFGIVYVFEDGQMSPVYHIPGKSPNTLDMSFTGGDNVYPMSVDNNGQSTYINNEQCTGNIGGYWGLDSEGDVLEGEHVRHHRFPMRKDIGLSLVKQIGDTNNSEQLYNYIESTFTANVKLPVVTEDTEILRPAFDIVIEYTVDGNTDNIFSFVIPVDPSLYQNDILTNMETEFYGTSNFHNSDDIEIVRMLIEVPQDVYSTELEAGEDSELINGIYLEFGYYNTEYSSLESYYFATVPTLPTLPISDPFPTSSFVFEVTEGVQTFDSRQYETDLLGIRLSGIELPSIEDTNGEKVIGYYIVRNERVDSERTILDSAVLVPTLRNKKYVSNALIQPEWEHINSKRADGNTYGVTLATQEKTTWGIIHPEHKFHNKQLINFDEIIQEGNFDLNSRRYGKISQNDVTDGSSWQDGMKRKLDDGPKGHTNDISPKVKDGFSLDIITRDNIVDYRTRYTNSFHIDRSQIEDVFYLDALEEKVLEYPEETDQSRKFWNVYNLAADNKTGFLKIKNDENTLIDSIASNNLPYVIYKRNHLDPYSNFRLLPYYKIHTNMFSFDTNVETSDVFGGDTHVQPMRYVQASFWDNRIACRAMRTNAWNWVSAALLTVLAVVVAVFSFGTGVAASATLVGIGAALVAAGGAVLLVSSGIKEINYKKAYQQEWKNGLRETTLDDWVNVFYQYNTSETQDAYVPYGFPKVNAGRKNKGYSGPTDDSVQWIGEAITDLWFETSVNMSLRNGLDSGLPTHLNAPGLIESGNITPLNWWEYFGCSMVISNTRHPLSALEQHLHSKLLMANDERVEGFEYLGVPLGEYYNVNPDYDRMNKQKVFYHLPLEYDCCSDCQEQFPQRIHYSEQSYQEELSDNFRIFLSNNYRDIEGETGKITNLYRLGMDLFVHTEEALWQIPRNYQERVTDQIVSFIGTGEYFAIPPRKIVDDDTGNSAGCIHKWGVIKTPMGLFFPSENQNKIYQFDGKALKAISNTGINNWFKENIPFKMDANYFKDKKKKYPFRDNPSNPYGTGFISTYDSRKERIIFTKKDFLYGNDFENNDFEICTRNGELIIFPNISQTIENQEELGWTYTGLENCRMKFQRDVIKTRTETRYETISIPNTAHIYAFFDNSGSFNATQLQSIRDAVDSWYAGFRPDDIGMTRLHKINNGSERWLNFSALAAESPLHTGDILVLSFVNEASPNYHTASIVNPIINQPTTGTPGFTDDYNIFVNTTLPSLNSFLGINYSITTNWNSYNDSKAFTQHTILAINGTNYGLTEAQAILNTLDDTIFTSANKSNILDTMLAPNPYQALGTPLKDLGWLMKVDRNDLDYLASEGTIPIITPEQFTEDINELLEGITQVIEVETEVSYIETEYMYLDGEVLEDLDILNNSWTLSFSLKNEAWISWHSYIPSFYINVPEDFFSWIHNNNNLWKHNKLGNYQNFYGKRHPFIVEFVSLSNPLITRIWDYLKLITEAKRYSEDFNEFVDERFITFNKGLFYNSRQCSGILNLMVKDTNPDNENYLLQQVQNLQGDSIIIDRNEGDWHINQIRDIRTDYSQPIFKSKLEDLQDDYYIDKVVNEDSIDYDKDWTELESFRDKYLVVRLIFDNFDDVKLLLNYSVENEVQSFR